MLMSIVMAYYNRKPQLLNTLRSISASSISKDQYEVIIVDDCSDPEHRLNDISGFFGLDIKVIEIDKTRKNWYNPCITFNIGFNAAKGNILVIQNPECLHYGDCLKIIESAIGDNVYVNLGCYSLGQEKTEKLLKTVNPFEQSNLIFYNTIKECVEPINNVSVANCGEDAWYNHAQYRPVYYHFLSAMYRYDMDQLGGFDNRFGAGLSYDDDEFLRRIARKKMCIKHCVQPFAIHQYHYSINKNVPQELLGQLTQRNRELYNNVVMYENIIKANQL
jgi:glycosyltransferase involved in cell wall biosynthesis